MKNPIVSVGHQVLRIDFMYDFYQNLVGGVNYRDKFVSQVLEKNKSIKNYLDLGSGTSEIIKNFKSEHNYIGLDYSNNYLEKALRRNKTCNTFNVFNYNLSTSGWSNIVNSNNKNHDGINAFALGLLHHLDDDATNTLLHEIHSALEGRGEIFTLDPIITPNSSAAAKWFARNDRGKFVRSEKELISLFLRNGFEVQADVKSNQFRIPLDTIEICAKPI